MAVNPLDPTKPTLGDLVEVDEELRAIKSRLVWARDSVAALEASVTNLLNKDSAISALGRTLDQVASPAAAQTAIGGKTAGRAIFTKESVPEIVDLLGLNNLRPSIRYAAMATGYCFMIDLFPLRIQVYRVAVPARGHTLTFVEPFPTACMGAVGMGVTDSPVAVYTHWHPTKEGMTLDHNGGSPEDISLIVMGY